jgi:hypothetical protein
MRWREFEQAVPELAAEARRRFEETKLSLLGTLRKDGWPRISPCEAYIVDGELLLGMIWRSKKALDLLRDPRLVVHSAQCDREGAEGDVKLYGRVVDVTDPHLRERYAETLQAAIDWRPTEPYNLFAVDIEWAGFVRFGKDARSLTWAPDRGLVELATPES